MQEFTLEQIGMQVTALQNFFDQVTLIDPLAQAEVDPATLQATGHADAVPVLNADGRGWQPILGEAKDPFADVRGGSRASVSDSGESDNQSGADTGSASTMVLPNRRLLRAWDTCMAAVCRSEARARMRCSPGIADWSKRPCSRGSTKCASATTSISR